MAAQLKTFGVNAINRGIVCGNYIPVMLLKNYQAKTPASEGLPWGTDKAPPSVVPGVQPAFGQQGVPPTPTPPFGRQSTEVGETVARKLKKKGGAGDPNAGSSLPLELGMSFYDPKYSNRRSDPHLWVLGTAPKIKRPVHTGAC